MDTIESRVQGTETEIPEAAPVEEPDEVLEGRGFAWWLAWTIAVVAIVAAGLFAWLWWSGNAADRTKADVEGQTRSFLVALTNFHAATIQQDVAKIRSFAVGDFATQVNQFFGPAVIQAIQRADASSTGTVQSVFVEQIAGSQAQVFAVVNESVQNSSSPARTEVVRFEVSMIDTSNGWKVQRVDILQSPGTPQPALGGGP